MSGSDLVQKFVGEGSRLVKDIFQLARDKSPSILFIDEIDAVGSMLERGVKISTLKLEQ